MDEAPRDIVDIYADEHPTKVVEVEEDRCFTCGARAYVYATLQSGRGLALCFHHGTQAWDRLNREAIVVIDHRDQLVEDEKNIHA